MIIPETLYVDLKRYILCCYWTECPVYVYDTYYAVIGQNVLYMSITSGVIIIQVLHLHILLMFG
jgi:hypothetical protein